MPKTANGLEQPDMYRFYKKNIRSYKWRGGLGHFGQEVADNWQMVYEIAPTSKP